MVSGRKCIWKGRNLSGPYHIAEIVNDRPAYKVSFSITKTLHYLNFLSLKRDYPVAGGGDIYLWHYASEHKWFLSNASDYQARNSMCLMYIKSKG